MADKYEESNSEDSYDDHLEPPEEAVGGDTPKVNGPRGLSKWEGSITMLNAFLGTGPLVIPYAFVQSGWCFAFVLVGIAMMAGFTLWLMGALLLALDDRAEETGVPRLRRDWSFLGYSAFGKAGSVIFFVAIFSELFGNAVSCASLTYTHLASLLPEAHHIQIATTVTACCFLLCFVSVRSLPAIAAASMACLLMLFLVLFVTIYQLANQNANQHAVETQFFDLHGLSSAAGAGLFAMVAHSSGAIVFQMLEDRKQWPHVAFYSTSGATVVLLFCGLLVYGCFGQSTAQIVNNVGRDLAGQVLPGAGNHVARALSLLFVSARVLAGFPLVVASMGKMLGARRPLADLTCKALLTAAVSAVVFATGGRVSWIVDFVGTVTANLTVLLLPSLAFFKLEHRQPSAGLSVKLVAGIILVASVVYGFWGLRSVLAGPGPGTSTTQPLDACKHGINLDVLSEKDTKLFSSLFSLQGARVSQTGFQKHAP
ncbi:AVT1H [Symbiodinium sp. CCMP2592]|nr:AVT1H [Symbiodinium sp. CCMP2592]